MIPLSIRHIEVFQTVMSTPNLTTAAVVMRTSQPTISREIRNMEKIVGFSLFERKGRHLRPTNEANALFSEVRKAFMGLEAVRRSAAAIRDSAMSSVRIASIPSFTNTLIPSALAAFRLRHPTVRFVVHVMDQQDILAEIAARNFDIGIVEADGSHTLPDSITIDLGNLLCLLPRGHQLENRELLHPHDFTDADFIYFSADDVHRPFIDRIFEELQIPRKLIAETTTSLSVCALVQAGIGISIINPLSALNCDPEKVSLRAFSVPVPYSVALVSAMGAYTHPLKKEMIDTMAAELRAANARIGERLEQ
ncbi:LysR substrate-binding domain-containing protein [Mesorhizobium sp. A623]